MAGIDLLKVIILHDPDIDVLVLSVTSPLVLSQVGELGTASVRHGTFEDVFSDRVIGNKGARSALAATNLHANRTAFNTTLHEKEVGKEISRLGITVDDIHLRVSNTQGGSGSENNRQNRNQHDHINQHLRGDCEAVERFVEAT